MNADEKVEQAFLAAVKADVDGPTSQEISESWEMVSKAIVGAPLVGALNRSAPIQPRATTRVAPTWRYLSIAAAIIILAIGIKYIPTSVPQTKTYTTERGQRSSITLSDGSTVMLAPATTIQVSGRDIELNGEAIFTVTQDKNSPFAVKTGNIVTRVLGTTFGIRAYNDDVRVFVSDGRVAVQSTVLATGDVATLNDSHVALQHNTNVSDLMAWSRGELVLHEAPLSDALTQLSRWYNVDFHVSDSTMLKRHVSAVFPATLTEEHIQTLATILDARATRSNGIVTFSPIKQSY